MKKILFLVLFGANFLLAGSATEKLIQINDNILLEVTDDQYIINFTSPYCEERVVSIKSKQNSADFSRIVYGKDTESIHLVYDKSHENVDDLEEIFDYIEGEGQPNIPFITLNFQIPSKAKYHVHMQDIQYADLQTGKISSTPAPYILEYAYLPCQEFTASEDLKEIQFDRSEYSKEQFNDFYTISEPYGVLGTQGFTFNIFPFIYLPAKQSIVAIHSAKFIITIDSDESLVDMMESELSKTSMAKSGTYLYDNYLGTTKIHNETTDKGRYIIITTSDTYANALTPYITHKRNIGYDVLLHVQSGGYVNATALRNYIKSMYDNIGSRPQYVLLVGDYSQIPFSYGALDDANNPPTDIYYACLEKSAIGTETNFFPEVYIGRWPVNSAYEITSIANKVINFEQLTSISRVFELYSGTGSSSSIFESDNEYAYNQLLNCSYHTIKNIKGSYGWDTSFMLSEFANYNILMMVYNGHGNSSGLGQPYSGINIYSISSISRTPRYMVGFACLLNYPTLGSFGSTWMRYGDKTLAFYGSTVTTTTSSDTYLNKHIFDYFKGQASNLQYSQFMQYSAGKYYNALPNSTRKKETKKYLFLGDPTTYTFGLYSSTGNPRPYSYIPKKDDIILNDTEKILSVSIYNTLGQLITSYSNISDISDIQTIQKSLNKGIYVMSIKTTQNEYVQKISIHNEK